MLETIFSGLDGDASISIVAFGEAILSSLLAGIMISFAYMYRNTYRRNFVITLSLLPIIISLIIMLVNGNIGTGVAVMGAFSLIRFRSIPGGSKEIGNIFAAMAPGLACGMGYISVGLIFAGFYSIVYIIMNRIRFGRMEGNRLLRILIPEELNYVDVFDDVFRKFTKEFELIKIKTSNMGTMFDLTYRIVLSKDGTEKEFIDELRCRNGNLRIDMNINGEGVDIL